MVSHVFLDTEFNGPGGELISLAMVSTDGAEFYNVVAIPEKPHPWVLQNVIPILGQRPVGRTKTRAAAFNWLLRQSAPLIIADWPADFIHLLELMYKDQDPMQRFRFNPRMELIDSDGVVSHIKHNALSDARGLMAWYMANFDE